MGTDCHSVSLGFTDEQVPVGTHMDGVRVNLDLMINDFLTASDPIYLTLFTQNLETVFYQ